MAQADSHHTSRRTFVGLATAAILSPAASAATGVALETTQARNRIVLGATPDADPVFGAIERHRAALHLLDKITSSHSALEGQLDREQRRGAIGYYETDDDPRWTASLRKLDAASDALDDRAGEILDAVPTTIAGLTAVLRYAYEFGVSGNDWPNFEDGARPGHAFGANFSVLLHRVAANVLDTLAARA